MALRGWGRSEPTPRPENTPAGDANLPDLHPAQIDLLTAEAQRAAALGEIDAGLAQAGNARSVMRDRLLDARIALMGQTQ
jgi:hypothetical protein